MDDCTGDCKAVYRDNCTGDYRAVPRDNYRGFLAY
jgi:hypothetical protein